MVGDLNLGTLIAAAINFILLVILLRLVAYKPILAVLEARRQRVVDHLAKADADRAEAERLREETERHLVEAKQEAQAILDRAQRAAAAEEAEILNHAREEAARLLAVAREEIAGERRQAVKEIQAQVADLSVLMAEKLLRGHLDPEAGHRLVRDFLAREGSIQ